ncbi:hypothetical protein D9611_006213 [Ephemerocybe angulata]|uniref:WD40 repeat-like protein n=1 Tax=Ephemerocybe angulata TaxID=980116 RepID=A0A8H5C6D6_9AGAR|nr:hypothetical protein D9611_006213 [Tulosesus angulatus]
MPRDLPGFYWDAERNRYFPLSARPLGAPIQTQPTDDGNPSKKRKAGNSKPPTVQRMEVDGDDALDPSSSSKTTIAHAKRKSHPWSSTQSALTQPIWDWSKRERIAREIQAFYTGATSRLTYNHAPTFGKITTFCTYGSDSSDPNDSGRWHLLGDQRGWLFRCKASYRDHDTEEPSRLDSDFDVETNWLPWSAELNLQPSGFVSSISMWGSRWIATGAGASARFASSDIKSLDRMFIVTLPGARDLWASHLRNRSAVFGASFRAIYIPDIDQSRSPEQLNTHSDVFTVVQDEHLIYTGARNGSIHRFDKRVGFKHGDLLLDGRFRKNQRSSVLNLTLLGGANDDPAHWGDPYSSTRIMENGLLVSQMNGDLKTFDLRFVTSKSNERRGSQPVVIYNGHVNNHTRELGLAVDHGNNFLYAAGQDCRIRGWSISSGEPIVPHTPLSSTFSSTSPATSTFLSDALANFAPMARSSSSNPGATSTPASASTVSSPWAHFNPFLSTFNEPVPVLRVSSDDTKSVGKKSCLWAASGEDVWRWNLGQQNGGGGGMV